MAAPGGVKLFFFQQKRFRQPPKRYRKLPEELPQSLRFAHLNPKVAAYLANKEKVQRPADEADGLCKTSLLPEITQSFHHVRSRIDSLLENDEDSQRYLYEEARLSAPGVLAQLTKYLYSLEEINTCIPKSLEYLLMMGWKEMTADVVPVSREWQTLALRDIYPPPQLSEEQNTNMIEEEKKTDREPSDFDMSKVKSERNLSDSSKFKLKPAKSIIEEEELKPSGSFRRMDKSTSQLKPKVRHGRLKSLCAESRSGSGLAKSPASQRGSVTSTLGDGSPADNKYAENTFVTPTIHFQLSSQACKEKGWLVRETANQNSEDNMEPPLELAIQILHTAIKKAKEEAENADPIFDMPSKLRYYKEYSQTLSAKLAKPTQTITSNLVHIQRELKPRIPDMMHSDARHIMQASTSDGTTVIYYPSGRPAIVSSLAGFGRPGFYTLVYGDEPSAKLMACFTPMGKGMCLHKNGNVRFQITKKGGHTADTNGTVLKKWKWPASGMKLPSSISLMRETAKFILGPVEGAVEPKPGDEEQLLTSFSFTSKSATDLNQIFAPKKPPPKAKKKKEKVKSFVAEAQKILDDRGPDDTDPDAEKDLRRLQRKTSLLVDNWMEHYRIYIGLSTGSLKFMRDVPDVRKRNIQSAKISTTALSPVSSKTEVDIESPDPLAKLRAPSAPASSEVRERLLHRAQTAGSSRSDTEVKDKDETDAGKSKEDGHPDGSRRTPSQSGCAGKHHPLSTAGTKSMHSLITHTAPLTTRSAGVPFVQSSMGQCPVALRAELLGFERPHCRCSRHHIPYITDIEFDSFLQNEVSINQLIIVAVVSTLYPDATSGELMIERIHANQNRNRTRPCVAARYDAFRILRYDIASAANESDHMQPVLLSRHNVVPGMFLIYHNGNLVFCDHIFNGYGNAKRDFRKQIMKCRADAIHHRFLPKDFHFSPSRGRIGPRSAWGGQIGGAGVDNYGNPGMSRAPTAPPAYGRPESSSSHSTQDRLHSVPSKVRGSDVNANLQSVSFASNASYSGEILATSQPSSRSIVHSSTSERVTT